MSKKYRNIKLIKIILSTSESTSFILIVAFKCFLAELLVLKKETFKINFSL